VTQIIRAASNEPIEVIIETPKDSRIKFKYNPREQHFEIDRILPQGLRFPFNFGFVPDTIAPDGDPTDVLIIIDEPLFPGCHASCRVLGLLQAEQTENRQTSRNDRIVAVSVLDRAAPSRIAEVPSSFFDDCERFFITYHQAEGNSFKVLGVGGIQDALELIRSTSATRG
jgi:inorganic pyrophosphatase